MDHLLFCVNHEEKIAKKHCKQCDQNLCNECVFDLHIEHHTEIDKIEYSMDTKQVKYSQILSEEINAVVEKTMKELKPKISQLILEKTEEYIKSHKNLQLKLNQPKEKNPYAPHVKEEKHNDKKPHGKEEEKHNDKKPLVKEEKHIEKKPLVKEEKPKNVQAPGKDKKNTHETLKNQAIPEKPKPKINDRSKMFEPKQDVFKKAETKKKVNTKISERAKMFEQNA